MKNKKRQNPARMKQPKPFEYYLPRDSRRLAIDAHAYGALEAVRDGLTDYTTRELDIRALVVCHQLRERTKARMFTNDYYAFCNAFKKVFLESYTIKQSMFRDEETSHEKHMQGIQDDGGWQVYFEQLQESAEQVLIEAEI